MIITEETLKYLQDNQYSDIISLIQTRELQNKLENTITRKNRDLNLKIRNSL
jgi:hypothetical protein